MTSKWLRKQCKEIDPLRPDRAEVSVDARDLTYLQPLGYCDNRGIGHTERKISELTHELDNPVEIRGA